MDSEHGSVDESKTCDDFIAIAVAQAVTIIIVFQLVHLVMRRVGQPRVVSEILSGMVVGSVADKVWPFNHLFQGSRQTALQVVSMASRIFYMFLLGLELDPRYLWQSKYKATLITFSTLSCSALSASASSVLARRIIGGVSMPLSIFTILFFFIISGTSAPTVARTAAELKLATFDIGRLAITSSIISDIIMLVVISLDITSGEINVHGSLGFGSTILHGFVLFFLMRRVLLRVDRSNQRGEVTNLQFGSMVSLLVMLAFMEEATSINNTFIALMFGLAFPKTGKMARSVMGRLHGLVHEILLPVLFAYGSLGADISQMKRVKDMELLALIVALSLASKVVGSLVACRLLGIPLVQSLVMGFMLNVKGQVDFIILNRTLHRNQQGWEGELYVIAMVSFIMNTMITPPVVTAIVRYERRHVAGYKPVGLEELPPEMELRMLVCTHSPVSLPALLSLIEGSRGPFGVPTAIYLMHLIELTNETSSSLLCTRDDVSLHRAPSQAESAVMGDDNDYAGASSAVKDHREMEVTLYNFRQNTGIAVRQVRAISLFHDMHEDVCNGADDLRASIIILPFHKNLRIDGTMETTNFGHRGVNCKVIQHARCTVGVLIDRGLAQANQVSTSPDVLYQVGVLFFGGCDDREALAYGARMSEHPGVSLTVIRFRPTNEHEYEKAIEIQLGASGGDMVLTKISEHERERTADEAYVSMFYKRYVVTGTVTYLEKYVANGSETVGALGDLQELYTLLLVGKGATDTTPLTAGMSDWEECPELGHIGDLLASSDFGCTGSVLIIQQCRNPEGKVELEDDAFA